MQSILINYIFQNPTPPQDKTKQKSAISISQINIIFLLFS